MALVMTKEWIRKQCRQNKLFQTPALNDRLYLHNQGFSVIENLEEYIEVKFLYLENNCIESLSGLKLLTQLRCLYLHKNCLRCIEHLEPLKNLDTLDLSENMLTKLENLACCQFLTTLNVASNYLRSLDSIIHLMQCPSITYGWQTIISSAPQLNHLDQKPVFWDEHLYAEAWAGGGTEAESEERDRVKDVQAKTETLQFHAMRKLRDQNAEERMQSIEIPLLQFDDDEFYPDPVPDIHPSLPMLNPGPEPDDITKLNPFSVSEPGTKDFVDNCEIQVKLESKLIRQPDTATDNVEREVNPAHEWRVTNLELQLDDHLSRSTCHHPQSKGAMEVDFQVQSDNPYLCTQPNPESENALGSQFETNSRIGPPVCSPQAQVQLVGDLYAQRKHEHPAAQCGLYQPEPEPEPESECTANCEAEPHNELAVSRIEHNSKQLQVESKFHTFSKLSRFQCHFHIENQFLVDVTPQIGAAGETESGLFPCCKIQALSNTSPETGHASHVLSPQCNAQITPLLVGKDNQKSAQEQTSKPEFQVDIKVDSKFHEQDKPDLQSQIGLVVNFGADDEVTCDQFLQLQLVSKHQTEVTPADEPNRNTEANIQQELVQHTRSENPAEIHVELSSSQNIGVVQKWEALPPPSTDLHISNKPSHQFKGQPEAAGPSYECQSLRELDSQKNSLLPLSVITPEAVYLINPVFEFDPEVQKSPGMEFELTKTQLNPVFELDTKDQPECGLEQGSPPHLENEDQGESGLTAEGEGTPDSKPERSTDV